MASNEIRLLSREGLATMQIIIFYWCQSGVFMSHRAPITLHTDASDYGAGGYSFQTVDGIDQPVAFVSRSLNKSQLRWSVIQKEAYGIFVSCMYVQSLLRDRFFTIRTDHRNLLFITEASNPMVVRWYMALSEFSFSLESYLVLIMISQIRSLVYVVII